MSAESSLLRQLNDSQAKIIKIVILPFFLLLFSILIVSSGFYLSNVANLIFRNYGPNFSYWLNVGDQFQLERSIKKFNSSTEDWKMMLKHESFVYPINIDKDDLYIEYPFNLNLQSNVNAQLFLKTKYPVAEVLVISILILLLFLLVVQPIGGAIRKMLNKFKNPLENFILRLSSISDLNHIPNVAPRYDFDELNQVNDAVFKMVARLRVAGQKIRNMEKEMIISDVVKQVSHDLISPLTVQKTILENIKEKLEPSDYEMLNLSVERIEGIASQVLESHRAQKSRFDFSCLSTVVNEKKIEKNYEKIQFENNLTKEVNLYVDELKLLSVISNLLNNAIEASSDSKGQVSLSVYTRDGLVCLEIKDEGAGIPDDVLTELGGKGATFGKTGGNGLGLYSAKKFTEKNKGHFKITSEFGVGTSVKISFPLNS